MAAAPDGKGEANGVSYDELVATAPENVTIPPKAMRAQAERIASFIALKGAAFGDRLRADPKMAGKFPFLDKGDTYYPFYVWRLTEHQEGRANAPDGQTSAAGQGAKQAPKGPAPPSEFKWTYRMPRISAEDLDVIRLTALHVAKNGRPFAVALAQKEAGNYQFDFLRAQHSLHQFYQRMVDQYIALINLPHQDNGKVLADRMSRLQVDVDKKFGILERAKQRAEYQRHVEKQKQQKEDETQKEKLAFAQIDWGNFAVAATIEFGPEDDEVDYPPPESLNNLQSASLEKRAAAVVAPNRRLEEGLPSEEFFTHGYDKPGPLPPAQMPGPYPQYTPQPPAMSPYPSAPSMNFPAPPPPPPSTASPRPPVGVSASPPPPATTPDAAAAARRPANPPMNIRSDYVPLAQQNRRAQNTQICPNCKQAIPINELQEHMRIELLDPRWKEQRAKNEAKYSTTNLSTADVANNLKRLASQRSDLFDGVTGEAISEEEALRRKRAATQYDGYITGAAMDRSTGKGGGAHKDAAAAVQQMGGMSTEEQIRRIREKNQIAR